MTTEEAISRLKSAVEILVGTEKTGLFAASGRVLAQDLVSGRDIPGFDNAAVDGYAFNSADLEQERHRRLPISSYIQAGQAEGELLKPGTAARIFTGARMPEGADTVVMQEDVRIEEGFVILPDNIKAGINRRPRGEDVKRGQQLLAAGHKIRPQDIGMAAAIGYSEVEVYKPLKVALFSTGNEILEPGEPLGQDSVYDVNRYMLNSLLTTMGCQVTDLGILKDDRAIIEKSLTEAAQDHHVLVTSGGASTGDADHIAEVMEQQGTIHFWRLAIKPGRPLAFGTIDNGSGGDTRFIGFPGNPVAVAVCFFRFAYPLLASLAGQNWPEPRYFELPSAFNMKKKNNRREWVRARLITDEQGRSQVDKHRKQGSGMLTSLVEGDGLVELADEVTEVRVGDRLPFMPFSQFGF